MWNDDNFGRSWEWHGYGWVFAPPHITLGCWPEDFRESSRSQEAFSTPFWHFLPPGLIGLRTGLSKQIRESTLSKQIRALSICFLFSARLRPFMGLSGGMGPWGALRDHGVKFPPYPVCFTPSTYRVKNQLKGEGSSVRGDCFLLIFEGGGLTPWASYPLQGGCCPSQKSTHPPLGPPN